jgi:hypothetical protein
VSIGLLSQLSGGNLNTRAALLEVINDALGSVAVLAVAGVIAVTGWDRADAVASLLIGALIVPRAPARHEARRPGSPWPRRERLPPVQTWAGDTFLTRLSRAPRPRLPHRRPRISLAREHLRNRRDKAGPSAVRLAWPASARRWP